MGKVISRERERERATINLERGTKVGVRYEYGTLTVIYYYFTVLNNTKIERYNRENNEAICMISFIRESGQVNFSIIYHFSSQRNIV